MRTTLLTVALILLLMIGVTLAGELMIWAKLPNVPNYGIGLPEEAYGIHTIDRESYGEGYFFLSSLDDGTFTFVNLFVSNLGPGTNNTSIDFTISEPNGQNNFGRTEFSSSNVTFTSEHMDVRVGENRMSGRYPNFNVKVAGNGLAINMKYRATLPGFAINSGRVCYGDPNDFYSNYVLMPRAEVSGIIKTPSGQRAVKGYGYCDHGRVTMMPHKYSRRWFSLRCFDEKYTLNILEFTVPQEWGGRTVPMITFAKGNKILYTGTRYSLKPSQWQTDSVTGLKWPKHFEFSIDRPGKVKIDGTYTVQKTIDAIDALSHMSFLERQIARFFAKSFIYRFLVNVQATVILPDGTSDSFTQTAVSEVLYIQ